MANELIEHFNLHVPFTIAAGFALVATLFLSTIHLTLAVYGLGGSSRMDNVSHQPDDTRSVPSEIAIVQGFWTTSNGTKNVNRIR